MEAKKLIETLKAKGIRLYKIGDRLKWKAPKKVLTANDIRQLKQHKSDILKIVDGPEPIKIPDGVASGNLIQGDCLKVMGLIPGNSVDLIVTDPPYGYSFMGKDWDKAVPSGKVWEQCFRVLKPGGWAFIMSSPRQDVLSRMIANLKQAGFRIGFTSLYWTYASGFPKAHNISKAIDKKAGFERVAISRDPNSRVNCDKSNTIYERVTVGKTDYITDTATPEARSFDGAYGGFQPKPAVEVIIVVQKPPTQRTQVEQALNNGKGVTWLGDGLIPYAADEKLPSAGNRTCNFGEQETVSGGKYGLEWETDKKGRFPANLLISDNALGDCHSRYFSLDAWAERNLPFLIEPKASKKEKEFGLDNLKSHSSGDKGNGLGRICKHCGAPQLKPCDCEPKCWIHPKRKNNHPTVKPIKLMAYLITMGSREGDIVLDPFCGSGTTGLAACMLKRRSIGIEIDPHYVEIASARFRALILESYRNEGKKPIQKQPIKKTGFRDWTEPKNNVNICTGCENDCIYCYAKYLALRRKQVDPGQWSEMKIREHDVKKGRKLREGLVGFPSTHDISPSNIEAYLTVLQKLLQAGNEVLIVSKPRLDCIKQICEGSQPFKDKILFRFTIGAMDDKILSFWDSKAPKYQERKACLEYAYRNGFRTSVSMEPMLDTLQIERTIADLRRFVNEDIWLGTMNHLKQIKAGADKRLTEEIAIIEAGQTPEILLAIYKTFKDDPLIKWKTDAFNAIAAAKKRKTAKGWDIVKIKNDVGDEVDAVAPLIISASRRNDTPAHHSQWFMDGIRRGHLGYINRGIRYVSFKNAKVIVFWTKNPEPIMENLNEMDKKGIGYYFQYTLNDFDAEGLEPNLPPLGDRISTFKKLSGMIGPEKVIWRFDPFILTDTITKEHLIEKVGNLMKQLSGYTKKLVINFVRVEGCEHILKRIKPQPFKPDEITFVAKKIGALAKNYNLKVAACRVEADLSRHGIKPNKCIDDDLIKRLFKDDDTLMAYLNSGKSLKDKGQDAQCKCINSEDTGTINTCANGCLYCYANKSDVAVKRNLKKIEKGGIFEFLAPKNPKKLKD